jgi:hypothetical protein
MQGGLVTTTLTSGLVSGNNYSSVAVAALTADIPSFVPIIIGYGGASQQIAVTNGDNPPTSTAITFNTITANATYPVGTTVAYPFGVMLDRTTFAAITKTSSMTGILEITLTLISG